MLIGVAFFFYTEEEANYHIHFLRTLSQTVNQAKCRRSTEKTAFLTLQSSKYSTTFTIIVNNEVFLTEFKKGGCNSAESVHVSRLHEDAWTDVDFFFV